MIVAIDIGGTKIAVGLVTRSGHLIDSTSQPTRPELPYEKALAKIITDIEELIALRLTELDGIGIGVTGQLNNDGTLKPNAFLPDWSGHAPAADLAAHFKVTAAVENDADATALAEYRWGGCTGSKRLIYVTVSTGIGGGILINGELYRGIDGCHPEIGHHVVDPAGPICFCGANGCWEQTASGSALAAWAKENGGEPSWDARIVCDQAEKGNPAALKAVAREGRYLGIGLANLITIFAPEHIVLGGGLMQRWDLFRPYVESTIAQSCRLVPWQKTTLSISNLRHPGLAGAAAVWMHHHGASHDF